MLVLSRKLGEKIIISDNITITVVEVNGNRVRLGISAPNDVRVLRSELVGVWDGPSGADTAIHTSDNDPTDSAAAIAATSTFQSTRAPRASGGTELRQLLSARRRKG